MREDLKRGKMGGNICSYNGRDCRKRIISYICFKTESKAPGYCISTRKADKETQGKGKYVTFIDKKKLASSRKIDFCFVQL